MQTTIERINRVEACLRGLEYVNTRPDGSFMAINHYFEGGGLLHVGGKRHARHISSENLLSGLYRAYSHSFNRQPHYPLL